MTEAQSVNVSQGWMVVCSVLGVVFKTHQPHLHMAMMEEDKLGMAPSFSLWTRVSPKNFVTRPTRAFLSPGGSQQRGWKKNGAQGGGVGGKLWVVTLQVWRKRNGLPRCQRWSVRGSNFYYNGPWRFKRNTLATADLLHRVTELKES